MAQTYSNVPVLSKLKIGNQTYFLKDADARAILDAINSNVYASLQLDLGSVADGGSNLVTAGNIKDYVDQAVAVGIKVVVDEQAQGAEEPATTASKSTMGKIYLVQISGTTSGTYTEFITLDKGTSANPRYVWEKIGTTDTDLSNYVTNVSYANGTLSQTKNGQSSTVHTFGAFADADEGTATYTPAGTVTVNPLTQTSTSANVTYASYTPEGTVTVSGSSDTVKVLDTQGLVVNGSSATIASGFFSAGALPTKANDSFDEGTLPYIDTDEFNGGSLEHVSVTLTEGSVELGELSTEVHFYEGFLYGGEFPTFTQGSDTFTQGTLPSLGQASTGSFTTEGVVVNVDTTDSEMLVFSSASTASAVTAQGTFSAGTLPTFTQGTDSYTGGNFPYVSESDMSVSVSGNINYTAQEVSSITFDFTPASVGSDFFYEGTLPSFTEGAFSAGTLPSVDLTKFNGGAPTNVTLPTFKDATVLTNATATFTGSTVASALVTGVTYDKATANGGSFAGTQASITVTPKASE